MPSTIDLEQYIDALITFSNQTDSPYYPLKKKVIAAANDLSVLNQLYSVRDKKDLNEVILSVREMQLGAQLNLVMESLEKSAAEPTFSSEQFNKLLTEARLAVFENLNSFFLLGKETITEPLYKIILASVEMVATLNLNDHTFFDSTNSLRALCEDGDATKRILMSLLNSSALTSPAFIDSLIKPQTHRDNHEQSTPGLYFLSGSSSGRNLLESMMKEADDTMKAAIVEELVRPR